MQSHSTDSLPSECEHIQLGRQWHTINESKITLIEGSEWGWRPHIEDKVKMLFKPLVSFIEHGMRQGKNCV